MASDNYSAFSLTRANSRTNGSLSPPTPILRNSRISHDDLSAPQHHAPPPSATLVATLPLQAPGFSKRMLPHGMHQPSPSPGADPISDSHTTRNDSVREGDLAAVTGLRWPAVLDIEEEADLNVEPFAFKPVQLTRLVDPKSLEKLDNLGGVEGLLRGLGTSLRCGLSSDPLRNRSSTAPYGMQITPTSPAYEATIEDRQRIYGQNVLPQRPSKTLLCLVWLALQDKVIVSPMTPHSFLADVRMSS